MRVRTGHKSAFSLTEIMIVVAIIGVLAAIAIPNFFKARDQAQLSSILNNLRIIEEAKDQWAIENRKGTGDTPASTDIGPYLKRNNFPPTPVVGETYTVNAVGTPATAEAPVKLGTYAANSMIALP